MGSLGDDLQERLDLANARSGSVGAVVSLCIDGEPADAATGSLDDRSAESATVHSPFRMGSIAKVLTATVLQELLVDADRSLDEPVDAVLPGCLPPQVTGRVTWRQVLSHRAGIDGTFWDGFGDEPDAIGRYAAAVATLPTVFEPGDSWGYANSGFVLAGRAIEVLAGRSYEDAVTDRFVAPCGATSTSLWWPAPPPGAASGHHLGGEGLRRAEPPNGHRAMAPTGATGFTTARDLLTLADRGLADAWPDLAAAATPMPPGGGTAATHQSLGWRVFRWGDTLMFGHDGGAAGMGSFLRWVPERRTGIAVLSNTNPSAMLLWAELSGWFFEQAGITVPAWLPRSEDAAAEPSLAGVYRCRDATFTVRSGDEALSLEVAGLGGTISRTAELRPLAPGVYRASSIITDPTRIVSFESPRGEYRLVHAGPFTARADD